MAKNKIKVIFFIAGTIATDEENDAIDQFSARHQICIRNASMIGDKDAIENFDIVAGCVPATYEAAAALKPAFVPRETPKTPVAKVQQGSPLAPPVEAPKAPEPPLAPPAPSAKPKTPAPKPSGAAGWKPNA